MDTLHKISLEADVNAGSLQAAVSLVVRDYYSCTNEDVVVE